LLALAVRDTVILWSLTTGEEVKRYRGHKRHITSLAFTPDGRTLASASADGTTLLWQVPTPTIDPPVPLQAEVEEALWRDLASEKPADAYLALRLLVQSPHQAVALLKRRLQPLSVEECARLKELLRQLDDDDFNRREQATARLEAWGERILPAVRNLLKKAESVDLKRRLEQIHETCRFRQVSGEDLRWQRALTLLEWLKTPESQKLLQTLADGPVEDQLTHEAKGALRR